MYNIRVVPKSLFIQCVGGNELSFPWNLPLNMIEMLISFTLTTSGFSIGTASFVTGLYIKEFGEMAPKERLMPFVYLISSLVMLPLVIITLSCIVVVCSYQPFWLILYLLLILLVPVVPAIAITYILIRHSPTRRLSTGWRYRHSLWAA